jgi:N6-adenosine-specific RNA methylase IME4
MESAADSLRRLGERMQFGTILADPPWRFMNRTGKMAPEHRRLRRYGTMTNQDIMELPVAQLALPQSHLYLWVPNALVLEGLEVMRRWGFTYKTNIVWYKVRKDGGPDGRGVGFYFRNVTELILFGTRGNFRTLPPGRRQTNVIVSQKRRHSHKPDEQYPIIESCSPGPFLELFARHPREGWYTWGDEVGTDPDALLLEPAAARPSNGVLRQYRLCEEGNGTYAAAAAESGETDPRSGHDAGPASTARVGPAS